VTARDSHMESPRNNPCARSVRVRFSNLSSDGSRKTHDLRGSSGNSEVEAGSAKKLPISVGDLARVRNGPSKERSHSMHARPNEHKDESSVVQWLELDANEVLSGVQRSAAVQA
jgi:hypothetical protein